MDPRSRNHPLQPPPLNPVPLAPVPTMVSSSSSLPNSSNSSNSGLASLMNLQAFNSNLASNHPNGNPSQPPMMYGYQQHPHLHFMPQAMPSSPPPPQPPHSPQPPNVMLHPALASLPQAPSYPSFSPLFPYGQPYGYPSYPPPSFYNGYPGVASQQQPQPHNGQQPPTSVNGNVAGGASAGAPPTMMSMFGPSPMQMPMQMPHLPMQQLPMGMQGMQMQQMQHMQHMGMPPSGGYNLPNSNNSGNVGSQYSQSSGNASSTINAEDLESLLLATSLGPKSVSSVPSTNTAAMSTTSSSLPSSSSSNHTSSVSAPFVSSTAASRTVITSLPPVNVNGVPTLAPVDDDDHLSDYYPSDESEEDSVSDADATVEESPSQDAADRADMNGQDKDQQSAFGADGDDEPRKEKIDRPPPSPFLKRKMDRMMQELAAEIKPTMQEEQLKLAVIRSIQDELCRFWPGIRLVPYGSTTTGLAVRGSTDIDLCLLFPPNRANAAAGPVDQRQIVRKLADYFVQRGCPYVLALPDARMPVCKVVHVDFPMLNVDICVENTYALENTSFLKRILDSDDRVFALALYLKFWAKKRRIADPFRGTLSSYAYVCMACAFWRKVCSSAEDMSRKSFGELCYEMFLFYAHKLDYKTTVIAVAELTGTRSKEGKEWGSPKSRPYKMVIEKKGQSNGKEQHQQKKEEKADQNDLAGELPLNEDSNESPAATTEDSRKPVEEHIVERGDLVVRFVKSRERRENFCMCIEDPVEKTHNLGRMVNFRSYHRIRAEFMRACEILRRHGDLRGAARDPDDRR